MKTIVIMFGLVIVTLLSVVAYNSYTEMRIRSYNECIQRIENERYVARHNSYIISTLTPEELAEWNKMDSIN